MKHSEMLYGCVAHPCIDDRVKGHAFCKVHLKAFQKPGHYRIPRNKQAWMPGKK